ncbi:hypothetical protein EHW97_00870 [Aeromicrobium camelliae]|uniref:NlpC/P60 domain-containing protein n=1 Tax=Aeromicrobium camelliae TaxID=1538144 RepID=A0A3N6ZIT5_9ACTN|nr:C40 family peptidase [Aeromicrobium camelliae]RQN10081.1 hypothetical protein EHW97_00870 [Aeromicrobium camelliae]
MAARRVLVFPMVAALALLGATAAPSVAAPDDEDRVAAIQVGLVESRQSVNALYAEAAALSERFNGAVVAAEDAERELADLDGRISAAERELEGERAVVEELTIDQLTDQRPVVVFQSLLDAEDPLQLLERSSAYASTQDAMAGQIAQLEAKQAVVRSVRAQAAAAAERHQQAVDEQAAARTRIENLIATAEQRQDELVGERGDLLAELARLENSTVEEVTQRQDRIDERLDAGGVAPDPQRGETVSPVPAPAPAPAPKPSTPPPAPKPSTPPPANASAVEAMIAYARAQLGKPYGWGAAGPGSFDCSGLTMRALEAAGRPVPRTAGAQYQALTDVPVSQRQRGDLLFYANGSGIYHVTIYLGGGQMIHAPRPGRTVEIVPDSWMGEPTYAARPFA